MIGRVYKIEVNENDFYIGSTIKKLNDRQSQHNIRLKEILEKINYMRRVDYIILLK